MSFKFKPFQAEDLARAACHDGFIMGWSCGLGKSLAASTWALLKLGFEDGLKVKGRVLLVASEGLHQQLQADIKSLIGVTFTKLDSQQTYLGLCKANGWKLPNGFYITSYTQLSSNRVEDFPDLDAEAFFPEDLMETYGIDIADVDDGKKLIPSFGAEMVSTMDTDWRIRAMAQLVHKEWAKSIGEEVKGIRCCWSPSLAELCRNEFDCVVLDEGTRIKSEDAEMAKGVRLMNPKYRMLMTATPIKNRLPDLFFLLWWVAGAKPYPHPRFPYTPDDQAKFAAQYLSCEINLTKEKAKNGGKLPDWAKFGRGRRPRGKITAELCNSHRLWKFIAPLILRRRKEDTGEKIVLKQHNKVYVPMGTLQKQVYEAHLLAKYEDDNGRPALMAKLQALRSVAAAPQTPLLQSFGVFNRIYRSPNEHIPKYAAALWLIERIMGLDEQVVLFSSFHEPLDAIARRLRESDVPFLQLDGRQSAKKRGKLSMEFQKGLPYAPPVMLAGSKAMSEGNNWYLANNVILLAYDWAWDVLEQGINRVHRMNSVKDVNVWAIMCNGTVDLRLESLLNEKGDSSDLALDGKVNGQRPKEVSIRDILDGAQKDYEQTKTKEPTIHEGQIEADWPALRQKLKEGYQRLKAGESSVGRLLQLPPTSNAAPPRGTVIRFGQTIGSLDQEEATVGANLANPSAEANAGELVINQNQDAGETGADRRTSDDSGSKFGRFEELKELLDVTL